LIDLQKDLRRQYAAHFAAPATNQANRDICAERNPRICSRIAFSIEDKETPHQQDANKNPREAPDLRIIRDAENG
jgi:hypothetical protein